jgi:hypothetical protein
MLSCATVVPELDTCTASVANPANAYAAAIVDTSFIAMKSEPEKLPPLGQFPSAASSPTAEFVPDPAFPPRE